MVSHHLLVYGTVPAKQCTASGPPAEHRGTGEAVAANPAVAVASYIFGIERP